MDEYYTYSIQIVGLVLGALMLGATFFLVKAKKVQEKYSIIWIFIAIFILVISIFRGFMEWFSNLIGIYYAPSAFLAILIICSYLILMSQSVIISSLKRQNKSLIQELGLMKLALEELEKNNGRSGKDSISGTDN